MTEMTSGLASYKLFSPVTIGKDLVLKNRVVLSPLTRGRSELESHTPTDLMAEYYAQRASAGLIITEATTISPQGFGWFATPGIYTQDHVAGWKKVTDAVHAKDGKVFLQLWHLGRQAHSSYNDGKQIVSVSAEQLTVGRLANAKGEYVEFEVPRALETDEIPGVVDDYRKAAALAKQAGFDGVEILATGGYLIDLFLQSVTNQRTDKYGGSIENRARLLLEVVEAVKKEWSSDRIGVRLSPNAGNAGMGSSDNYETFVYAAEQLSKHNLAYLAIGTGGAEWYTHNAGRIVTLFDAKSAFKGTVMAYVEYGRDTGEGALRTGAADLVGYGRPYMANPDLVERFQNDWPLTKEAEREFWWIPTAGANGYTSFEPYKQE